MLDITRDKPIKVAVRVAVPVRDHPKVWIYFTTFYFYTNSNQLEQYAVFFYT